MCLLLEEWGRLLRVMAMTKLCPSPFIVPWQNGLDGPWVLRSFKSQRQKTATATAIWL